MGCQQSVVAVSHGGVEDIRVDARASRSSSRGARNRSSSRDCRINLKNKLGLHESPRTEPQPDFVIELEKQPGDKLGVSLGNTSKGAVIFNLKAGGLLEQYTVASSEERKLRAGFIIVDVNGRTGYWDIFEEMRKTGHLKMVISPTPPKGSSASWFQEIESMGRDLEAQGSNFVVRVQPHNSKDQKSTFSSLPMVRASDVGVDQCAICLGDVDPSGSLVQLPCGHAFHVTCAGRWLTEGGKHTRGKKQCCPLCCRRVVAEPGEGGGGDVQN